MKRTLALALLLATVLSLLPSCIRIVPTRPSDYLPGSEIVIDNTIPFVYDTKLLENDRFPVKVEGKVYSVTVMDMFNYCANTEKNTYADFISYCGNKPVRHVKSGDKDFYYTVYSLSNYRLLYLLLEPNENGTLMLPDFAQSPADAADILHPDLILDHDQPSEILGDNLPDFHRLEYYSPQELMQKNERIRMLYLNACMELELPSVESIQRDMRDENAEQFYRCLQSSAFDVIDHDRNESWHGYYCYDLLLYKDGTGSLHYRHFKHIGKYEYEIDEEATVSLTAEELAPFKTALETYDFQNIPTWNPQEHLGLDGETTYLIGGTDFYSTHLIGMWESNHRHGIYHLRTALEDLTREKIAPASGRVYVEYSTK